MMVANIVARCRSVRTFAIVIMALHSRLAYGIKLLGHTFIMYYLLFVFFIQLRYANANIVDYYSQFSPTNSETVWGFVYRNR